jgi:integrase
MTTDTVSPLRQRMIEDMNSRNLGAGTQRGHIRSCKRFAAFLKRSPDTTTIEDIRLFQLHLAEAGVSIWRLLAVATSLKARIMLSLGYGCGLRAGEVVRLKVKHIDSAQKIIRVEQSKGRKDRNVMLSRDTLDLLRQWWKVRRSRDEAGMPSEERWLFPGHRPGKPMSTRHLRAR